MIPSSEYAVQPGSHKPCLTLVFERVFYLFRRWFGPPSRLEISVLATRMQAWQKEDLDFFCRPALANHVKETKQTARNGNVCGTRAAQYILNSGSRGRPISGVLPIFNVDFIHLDYQNVPASVQKSYPANLI